MIQEARQDCLRFAAQLPKKYEDYSIDELADSYCKAFDEKDELNKNIYFSALILRFWYTINKIAQKSPGMVLEYDEFFFWLAEAIQYACKYRAWQKTDKKVNAQQAINQCIETIRLQHYYQANLDKHKANFSTISLDAPIGDDNDSETTPLDLIEDEASELDKDRFNAEMLVQNFINNKKLVEAIILDTIAFNDCQKYSKKAKEEKDDDGNVRKVTHQYSQFWPYRVVQILAKLPANYLEYFTDKYEIVTEEFEAALNAVRNANNQKLYQYVNSAVKSLKMTITSSRG